MSSKASATAFLVCFELFPKELPLLSSSFGGALLGVIFNFNVSDIQKDGKIVAPMGCWETKLTEEYTSSYILLQYFQYTMFLPNVRYISTHEK